MGIDGSLASVRLRFIVAWATEVLMRWISLSSLSGINAERNWPLALSFEKLKRSIRTKRTSAWSAEALNNHLRWRHRTGQTHFSNKCSFSLAVSFEKRSEFHSLESLKPHGPDHINVSNIILASLPFVRGIPYGTRRAQEDPPVSSP